jgi:WXG100 family type VII secretion target
MAYEGMDPDEVEGLARRIDGEAQSLSGIITKLDGLVSSMQANWDGADSARFHDTYANQYRGQMTTAVDHLNQLSAAAIHNAGEQRTTSA